MAKTWNEDAAIRGALRRVFSRSPVIREVLRVVRREVPRFNKDGSRSKKDSVQYLCNVCKSYTPSTKISVDHIIPVVSVNEGFIDLNTFKSRLFCDASNLQAICDFCHNTKTQSERIERLLLRYGKELDDLELKVKTNGISNIDAFKMLKKYISKKKTSGLNSISERAAKIKETITGKPPETS